MEYFYEFLTAWVILGWISGFMLSKKDLDNGIDYDLSTVIAALLGSTVLGPIGFLVYLALYSGKTVIFKGKKK